MKHFDTSVIKRYKKNRILLLQLSTTFEPVNIQHNIFKRLVPFDELCNFGLTGQDSNFWSSSFTDEILFRALRTC